MEEILEKRNMNMIMAHDYPNKTFTDY